MKLTFIDAVSDSVLVAGDADSDRVNSLDIEVEEDTVSVLVAVCESAERVTLADRDIVTERLRVRVLDSVVLHDFVSETLRRERLSLREPSVSDGVRDNVGLFVAVWLPLWVGVPESDNVAVRLSESDRVMVTEGLRVRGVPVFSSDAVNVIVAVGETDRVCSDVTVGVIDLVWMDGVQERV